MNRRRFLARSAAFLSPAATIQAGAGPISSLRDCAARRGLLYGSDSDIAFSAAPPRYSALFLEQCALYAPIVSWKQLCPAPAIFDPRREDPNIAAMGAAGLKMTGAHMAWHNSLPPWFASLSPTEAGAALTAYIGALGRHYAGRFHSWNVVNEAIEPADWRDDGLRASPLLDKLGPDFFDLAFHAARRSAPDAMLVYNEYDLEMDHRKHEARRTALLRLLNRMKASKIPIDAVGLQSHLKLNGMRFDEKRYRAFLSDISAMGLKIFITELDVLDREGDSDTAARDRAIADMYARFLAVALDEPATKLVVTWGLSDRYTWMTPSYAPHFLRSDGRPNRPLPFDENLSPKPAYYAIKAAFEHAPVRRA